MSCQFTLANSAKRIRQTVNAVIGTIRMFHNAPMISIIVFADVGSKLRRTSISIAEKKS